MQSTKKGLIPSCLSFMYSLVKRQMEQKGDYHYIHWEQLCILSTYYFTPLLLQKDDAGAAEDSSEGTEHKQTPNVYICRM